MHIRLPSLIRVIACIVAISAFVLPANLSAAQPVSADPGIMKWDTVSTPGSVINMLDILNLHGLGANTGQGSEIIDMAAANDSNNVAVVVRTWFPANTVTASPPDPGPPPKGYYKNLIRMSRDSGISWTIPLTNSNDEPDFPNVFQVVFAPDNPDILVITTADDSGFPGPRMVWITEIEPGAGNLVFDGTGLTADETIRCVDVSIDYGGKRDIAWGTVNGTGAGENGGRWMVRSSGNFSSTIVQMNPNGTAGDALGSGVTTSGIDYEAIKFSPTYSSDGSVALVYADANATYYNVAFRDINANTTPQYAFSSPGIEVRNPASAAGTSPGWAQLNNVELQIPSDFSGQSASLRRAYISLDAFGNKSPTSQDGIYRIDDSTTYGLMDTTNTIWKSIYTIAYFGTYASGKLLAGERIGLPCTATVPTWFTDSPTTCPIPCWYPALKPTTGAANQGLCATGSSSGNGSALVAWNGDGSLGLVGTGSLPYTVFAGNLPPVIAPVVPADMGGGYAKGGIEGVGAVAVSTAAGKELWYQMQGGNGALFNPAVDGAIGFDAVNNDESAFAISRNNGETWNQLSLIDTTIDWFNDVAVAPDCTTIYLASTNRNVGANCNEFDSVWRASINPNVTAPLPAVPPLGTYWERVFCHVTSGNCGVPQSDLPILRVVPSCTDKKDGEIVGWAAQLARTNVTAGGVPTGGGVMAWSPDYGDYWAMITPRYEVQDFAFESSTTLYVLSPDGLVQRLPYTGTSWSTNLPSYDTTTLYAHTIVAVPDGKVLVGAAPGATYPTAYSADKGVTFNSSSGYTIAGMGNEHVIFDVDFKNNSFFYMGDDGSSNAVGTVYRNTLPSSTVWVDSDMMEAANGGGYIFIGIAELAWPAGNNPPHAVGQFGLAQAWTGEPQPALYSAHAPVPTSIAKTDKTNTDTIATAVTTGSINTVTVVTTNNGAPAVWAPWNSAVCRTLKPRDGMPKPGIKWDCLDIFAPASQEGVWFTLEPTSLKYCGCCTLDTNTTLYAIDDESGNWMWDMLEPGPDLFVPHTYTLDLRGHWNNHLNNAAVPWDIDFAGYTPSLRQGMLWAYTDCLAKKGPILKSPADKFLVGADPVTGRNQQVDLSWEQLCLSTWYELQIAKDAAFTLRINPAVNTAGSISAVTGSILLKMDATNMTSPAAWIAPGALPEAGAIYYWRIRSAKSATQQIAASPWSEVRSFTVKAGFIVNTPYYGVQLLAPNNGCTGCKVRPVSFSWSPWKEATRYQFELSKNPECCPIVETADTTTAGYEYKNTLDYSTNYFWRVRALEVNGQPIPSDWSATFSFMTEPVPTIPPPPPAEPAIPMWVWVLIAIGAILVIVIFILIFKSRRQY